MSVGVTATARRQGVSALIRDGRGYRVLEEINTEPAITYLARVREENA